jgi:hypothetical protein
MRRLKVPVTVLLFLLVFVDAVIGFHLWKSGLPKRVSLSDVKPGVAEIQVTSFSFIPADWLILIVILAFHAVLFYLAWKAWHSGPVRV